MATIRSVSMRRRENGKIYLSGYVDGLETGYNYCIVYRHNGGPVKNVGRDGLSYTFIGLSAIPKGTYRKHYFSDTNSWVPDDGDGTYDIICNMVGARCEEIHIHESTRSFTMTTPTPPACIEGETVCEYDAAYSRYMLKKCVGGELVFEKWCGVDDTCEDGVCISPAAVTPTPECDEGAIVCEYHEGHGRYLLKKCVGGKLVFEKWCGADDTCEDGVCISPKVCNEGEKRNPKTCWDGSKIYREVCKNNKWVPSGEVCPEKPECTEGDKKAGYICEGGKWKEVTVPEPVVEEPEVKPVAPPKYLTPEEADERVRAGLPCYIKCTLPILDMLPGIPYTLGAWVPPFCAITTKP